MGLVFTMSAANQGFPLCAFTFQLKFIIFA